MGMRYVLLTALACCLIAGCNQTESESETMGDRIGTAVEGAVESAADFTTDATMAATVTPSIKAKIIADDGLNDPAHLIDVTSRDRTVYLTGHVASSELKARAGEIAADWLESSSAPEDVKLVNELVVH